MFLAESKPNKITWTLFAVLLQLGLFVLSYELYLYDLENWEEEVKWRGLIAKNLGGNISD